MCAQVCPAQVYPCLPIFAQVCLCLPMFGKFCSCLESFAHVCQCLCIGVPMFRHVSPGLPMFAHVCSAYVWLDRPSWPRCVIVMLGSGLFMFVHVCLGGFVKDCMYVWIQLGFLGGVFGVFCRKKKKEKTPGNS